MALRQCKKCGYVMTDEQWSALRVKDISCSNWCHETVLNYELITGLQEAIMKARGLNQPPNQTREV